MNTRQATVRPSFYLVAVLAMAALVAAFAAACACGGGGQDTPAPSASTDKPDKADKGDGDVCPSRYKELSDQDGKTKCECKANPMGPVWGTAIYTTDSSICAAAVHAGVIDKKKGGKVTVKSAPGCKGYEGSKANGVSSGKWGSYTKSFYFPKKGDGKCADDAKGGDDGDGKAKKCPSSFKKVDGFAKGKETKLKCKCEDGQAVGSVWGSNVYTTDSSICAAAVHAGIIEKAGGKVKAKSFEGCKKYKGSDKNGVKTSNWGSFDSSFYFPKAGDPKCD